MQGTEGIQNVQDEVVLKEGFAELDTFLINPISAKMIPAFVPHGLLYLASYALREGYKVQIQDRNVDESDWGKVIREKKPKVIGIGCLTGTVVDDAVYLSKEIKKIDPNIKIVWGGIHVTLAPDSVLKKNYVDYVVIGDGEVAYTKILDYVVRSEGSLDAIDNLGFKVGQDHKYNTRSFVDLDTIPLPAWHLVDVPKYIKKKFYASRTLCINTSRGCPYGCSFCSVPATSLRNWSSMSAKKVAEHLEFLVKNYGIDGFQVDDDEFDIDRSRVLEFCDQLKEKKLKLKWSHFSRINIVKEDVVNREIDAGLSMIEFGIESGSPRMLKLLNKGQTVEKIRKAYEICGRLDVKTSALFMVGLPTEKIEDVDATVKLIRSLTNHQTICTIYRPYPGTELFDYVVKNGFFEHDDELENIGKRYERLINTSGIDTGYLLKIQSSFDRRNIFQEIIAIICKFNYGLFFYYTMQVLLSGRFKRKVAFKGAEKYYGA